MIEVIEALKASGKVIIDEDHDWGYQLRFVNEAEYCGKFLVLTSSDWGSLHYHKNKKETFIVIYGVVQLEVFDDSKLDHIDYTVASIDQYYPGSVLTVFPVQTHRMGKVDGCDIAVLLEVSTHDDDDDTYRIGGDTE